MSSFKKLKILYNKTGKLNCYNTEMHRVRHFFECYSAFTLRQIIPLIFSLLLDPPQLPNCKVNDISIWSSYILIVSQVLTWLFDFPLSTPDGNLSSWGVFIRHSRVWRERQDLRWVSGNGFLVSFVLNTRKLQTWKIVCSSFSAIRVCSLHTRTRELAWHVSFTRNT